jgi:hypothetical protein
MRSPVAELLAALGGALSEARVRWYVFGAQAAILHGAARLTADVDVTVEDVARPSQSLVPALERAGFALRVPDADAFVDRTRMIPLLHLSSGLPLDVVLAGPGLEERFFARAIERQVEGVAVPVASAEDLVVMKVLAGRAKDLEDVVAVLAANPDLDLALVRETLRDLEGALAQSDLLPAFERALARARAGTPL